MNASQMPIVMLETVWNQTIDGCDISESRAIG